MRNIPISSSSIEKRAQDPAEQLWQWGLWRVGHDLFNDDSLSYTPSGQGGIGSDARFDPSLRPLPPWPSQPNNFDVLRKLLGVGPPKAPLQYQSWPQAPQNTIGQPWQRQDFVQTPPLWAQSQIPHGYPGPLAAQWTIGRAPMPNPNNPGLNYGDNY